MMIMISVFIFPTVDNEMVMGGYLPLATCNQMIDDDDSVDVGGCCLSSCDLYSYTQGNELLVHVCELFYPKLTNFYL